MKITDEIAKALENKDLCRRAGPFWLEVMYFLTRPTGCAHRQRYAAITAREYLTALSMIKIPQTCKKCGDLASGDRSVYCHQGRLRTGRPRVRKNWH
ncbi:PerC family transcriptional regulator [Enterobacter mori]|uniref:PerC family transcriptional regulator n=1 Tax=Enterobacter mori TaxID=539813 RepID=UPI00398B5B8E